MDDISQAELSAASKKVGAATEAWVGALRQLQELIDRNMKGRVDSKKLEQARYEERRLHAELRDANDEFDILMAPYEGGLESTLKKLKRPGRH